VKSKGEIDEHWATVLDETWDNFINNPPSSVRVMVSDGPGDRQQRKSAYSWHLNGSLIDVRGKKAMVHSLHGDCRYSLGHCGFLCVHLSRRVRKGGSSSLIMLSIRRPSVVVMLQVCRPNVIFSSNAACRDEFLVTSYLHSEPIVQDHETLDVALMIMCPGPR
jgi:hypothetical protein